MIQTYNILSLLLDYPTAELFVNAIRNCLIPDIHSLNKVLNCFAFKTHILCKFFVGLSL